MTCEQAKEAIGGIAKLTRADGSAMTVNVEYNQLDPLLRACGWADGDANDASGYSPFPGNINQLIFALPAYAAQLAACGGGVAEFVNPKYADARKSAFKSPTRLECMMQDYAKTVPPATRVGFTVISEVWVGYSPVKNSVADALAKIAAGCPPHCAAAGECDMYGAAARSLALCGAAVGSPADVVFAGAPLQLHPAVVISPSTASTFEFLRSHVLPSPAAVSVSGRSALILHGHVVLAALQLDGSLVIRAAPGARVRVDGLVVRNAGWRWVPLAEGEQAEEEVCIRGFRVERLASAVFEFTQPGEHVLSGTYDS
jgi:UDP-sugar pyrophosphorylase